MTESERKPHIMDDICRTYGLRPIKLVDKPLFDAAFASLVRPVSEYTFANTFIWRTGEKLYWAPIAGHLCVFADGNEDLTMLYPPVGEGDMSLFLKRCFEIMDDYNARRGGRERSRIEYTSDEMLARVDGLGLKVAPMGGDYIYDMARLIDLAGSALKSKRHARNRFVRENAVWTEPLRPDHFSACVRLLRSWRDDVADVVPVPEVSHITDVPTTDARSPATVAPEGAAGPLVPIHTTAPAVIQHRRRLETLATVQALKHFPALGLTGMVVWAGERLVGFTFGQALTSQQASIVIEKADRRFVGAAQFIFSEFCGRYWHNYPECNAGDDWDIPGLAWTKASYRPVERLHKWTLRAASTSVLVGIGSPRTAQRDASITMRPATVADTTSIVPLEQRVFAAEDAFKTEQVRYLLRSPHALTVVACDGEFAYPSGTATPGADTPPATTVAVTVDPPGNAGLRVAAVAAERPTAGEKGKVVGWAVTLLRRHVGWTSARLYSLAVEPAYRGRRIGERLVQHVLDMLEQRGVERCFLEVREDNVAARRLYEKFGFRYVKHLPNYYGEGAHGWSMLRISTATKPALEQVAEAAATLIC